MQLSHCLHDSVLLMTIPEAIAVVTGVLSVWYARKESILVYPIGIISVLLYVYICLQVKLYADAAVNFYYFLASVYGWYFWLKGGRNQAESRGEEKAHIATFNMQKQIGFALLTLFGGFVIGYLLDTFTDSNVPYWDGITTAIFCSAMWLMARKQIENWVYWIIGDIICVPLFFSKGLCLSSLQYLIFTMLAVAGWITWNHRLKKRQEEQHA